MDEELLDWVLSDSDGNDLGSEAGEVSVLRLQKCAGNSYRRRFDAGSSAMLVDGVMCANLS